MDTAMLHYFISNPEEQAVLVVSMLPDVDLFYPNMGIETTIKKMGKLKCIKYLGLPMKVKTGVKAGSSIEAVKIVRAALCAV